MKILQWTWEGAVSRLIDHIFWNTTKSFLCACFVILKCEGKHRQKRWKQENLNAGHKITDRTLQNVMFYFWTTCHEIKFWWTVIHFHPCYPTRNPKLFFVLAFAMYNLFIQLHYIFGGILLLTWKLGDRNFNILAGKCPFNLKQTQGRTFANLGQNGNCHARRQLELSYLWKDCDESFIPVTAKEILRKQRWSWCHERCYSSWFEMSA